MLHWSNATDCCCSSRWESIVAIGTDLAEVELEPRMAVAAVLGLVLVSALWTYFAGDDERALEVLEAAPAREQLDGAFFYAFVAMLGIVTLAGVMALTIANVDVRTALETAALLGGGAAVYVGGDVVSVEARSSRSASARRRSCSSSRRSLGSGVSGMAQPFAIIAVFVAVLLFEKRDRPEPSALPDDDQSVSPDSAPHTSPGRPSS